jgi:hypothetical protein
MTDWLFANCLLETLKLETRNQDARIKMYERLVNY